MSVTIKQIAELANVSRGTVDKVLNDRPGVKEATKNKILKIVEELNYKPNYIGKALVQGKDPVRIGILLTPSYNPFIHEVIHGIQRAQDEFEPFGIKITIKMLGSLEPAEEMSMLNEFEREQYAGIAVFPLNDEQIIQKLNQISNEGTPVVTFNSRIKNINNICFIGQDNYKGGRTAAGLMSKILPEGGEVGIIIGSNVLSCHQERFKGFVDKCNAAIPNIKIVNYQENQDRKDEAFRIALEFCNKYPDLNGIYITGGGVAGVGNALNITGRQHSVKVICHDLIPDSIELLANGTVDFALGQNPDEQGYLMVKILFDYLIKKQSPRSNIVDIPIAIETQDTII